MKIAVATEGTMVAPHFGRCPAYTLVDVADGKPAARVVVPNPGHEPGFLPAYLAERGVNVIIAGGMGPQAQNLFEKQGIATVIGVAGPVDKAIAGYLDGSLVTGPSACDRGPKDDHEHCSRAERR